MSDGSGSAGVVLLDDRYEDDRAAGKVIGSHSTCGARRGGYDVERVISIDHGALRIEPLLRPGWGRAAVTYGPFDRENGLAFAVFMLNGHNTSQAGGLPDGLRGRLWRWWRGSETYSGATRIVQWLRCGRFGRTWRRLLCWIGLQHRRVPELNENLAVGWLPVSTVAEPLAGSGNVFVMHGTGIDSGEIWSTVTRRPLPSIRGVQNVPIYYVVILREKGAAYYLASLSGAHGMAAYPEMRPIAVDPSDATPAVVATVQQSVLGQIGFRLDTRIYSSRVAKLRGFEKWYGSAQAADSMQGSGDLNGSSADVGGRWDVLRGRFLRTARGVRSSNDGSLAVLQPSQPSGLIHVVISGAPGSESAVGVSWRALNAENHWSLMIGPVGTRLLVRQDGSARLIRSSADWRLTGSSEHSLQVLDDGRAIGLYLDGELLFGARIQDERLNYATGAGVQSAGTCPDVVFRSFEAHPKSVPNPREILMGSPWLRLGERVEVADSFVGPAGEMTGRTTSTGERTWTKLIGRGSFDLTGKNSARVRASVERPNPGRTAYTIEWHRSEFADLEITLIPPGTARGQGELSLCGFIFWQDPDNYITVTTWLKDTYESASISCFFQIDGFEDLYDAIWTNIGRRVYWGVPYKLRMVFDGERYVVLLNDEPVLSRALVDVYPGCALLQIRRVGLVANWEWGNDTGTEFKDFIARS